MNPKAKEIFDRLPREYQDFIRFSGVTFWNCGDVMKTKIKEQKTVVHQDVVTAIHCDCCGKAAPCISGDDADWSERSEWWRTVQTKLSFTDSADDGDVDHEEADLCDVCMQALLKAIKEKRLRGFLNV